MAISLILLISTYITATVVDPADDAVLKKSVKGTSATLDRTIHAHAIENNYCYLCETKV